MEKLIDRLIRNIVYLYLIILPWLVMPHKAYYTEDEKLLFSSYTEGVYDIFLYWKMLFTIAVSVILLILIVVSIIKYNYRIFDFTRLSDRILLVCGITYIVCTVMSYVCANYRHLALTGGVNSFEGTIVLLSYAVLFLAGRYVVQKCDYHHIEYITLFNAVVLLVLSIVEVNYKSIAELVLRHTVETDYYGMLCLTFYNSSYCAGFIIILLPICLYYYSVSKKLIRSIVWCGLSVTTLLCGFLTRSSAAFYILIFEVVMYIVTMAAAFFRNIKNVSNKTNKDILNDNKIIAARPVGILAGVIILLLVDFCIGGSIFNSAKSASVNETTAIHNSDYYKVNNIELNGSEVCITGDTNKLICGIDNSAIYFKDEEENLIAVKSQKDKLLFPEPYPMIEAYVTNDILCLNLGYKGELRFLMYNNTFYPALSDSSVVKDISAKTNISTAPLDSLFTGRGYIWRNTLPIIKNTFIFGHGAGTFEMYFKQFDFVGLLNSQGNVDLIIDKPHSLYLQIACNQGVLCSLAVIVLLLIIIIKRVCTIYKKLTPNVHNEFIDHKKIFAGISGALLIVAFMIFELITDSNITVNPLFIVILGMIGADL
ncbi:MAG: O-antigen ligase family protein [Eubacterium sp.]|nr:O-antigen ligase family protein [Eubacterium sp.]